MNFLKNYNLLFFVFAAIFSGSTKLFCPDLGRVNLRNLFLNVEDKMNLKTQEYQAIVDGAFDMHNDDNDKMRNFIKGLVACHLFAKELKKHKNEYTKIFTEIDELCCIIVNRLKMEMKNISDYSGLGLLKGSFRNAYELAFQSEHDLDLTAEKFAQIKSTEETEVWFLIPQDAVFRFVIILDQYTYTNRSDLINSAFGYNNSGIRAQLNNLLNLIKNKRGNFLMGGFERGQSFDNMYNRLIEIFPHGMRRTRVEATLLPQAQAEPITTAGPSSSATGRASNSSEPQRQRQTPVFFDSNVWTGIPKTQNLFQPGSR